MNLHYYFKNEFKMKGKHSELAITVISYNLVSIFTQKILITILLGHTV